MDSKLYSDGDIIGSCCALYIIDKNSSFFIYDESLFNKFFKI